MAAPLANNINHQQTAFGGSLFSVAALAGWGLLQMKMTELDVEANTVIAGGDVSYSVAVTSALTCHCELPPDYQGFVDKLGSRGKASIQLKSEFYEGDQLAMQFSGTYVVRVTTEGAVA